MQFKKFFNNLRYLFRYDLKQMYNVTTNFHYALDHIVFEIEENLKQIPNIEIKNNDETLNELINSNRSLSRFGDGELALMYGDSIPSQKADKELSQRLKNILLNASKSNLMIGLFPIKTSTHNSPMPLKKFTREVMGKYNYTLCSIIDEKVEYYSTGFTFPYIHTGTQAGKNEYFKQYYEKFKSLWKDKDIVIVCGERVFKNIKYNIFECAKSIDYIYGPTNSAFKEYNNILNQVLKRSKEKLIILILGATATVMSADLSERGYRALDIGHLAKDYDAFNKQVESTTENIFEFFKAE